MISRLHHITQDHPDYSHLELIEIVCEAGVDWIQLRLKRRSEKEIR